MTIQIVGNGEVGIMADISIKELIEEMVQSDPHKIILSGGRGEYRKVVFERKIIGGKRCFQIERYTEKQVFHQNIDEDELEEALAGDLRDGFRQINMFSAREGWDVKISKKGKIAVNKRHACSQEKSTVFSTSPITIATVHEIHLQLVFFVVIVALYHLFCKLFFLFFNCIFYCIIISFCK